MKRTLVSILILTLLTCACNMPIARSPQEIAALTASAETTAAFSWTTTPTSTPAPTGTATVTLTPTLSPTETVTLTPTITPTPLPGASPTFDFPNVVVNKQAFCRYGPAQPYLPAADLYAGDGQEKKLTRNAEEEANGSTL